MSFDLEIAKLIASTLTPISVALLGLFLGRAAKRFEARQWANQKVVEKRLTVYDLMTPPLNDLYCYLSRVGNWKEKTPPEVITTKRGLDRLAFIYKPLFTPSFFDAYQNFIAHCFETWTGEGHDARILTDAEKHRAAAIKAGKPWPPEWDAHFDVSKQRRISEVQGAYSRLMDQFALELGVGLLIPERLDPTHTRKTVWFRKLLSRSSVPKGVGGPPSNAE